MGLRVQPDHGPPVTYLPGGSSISEDDGAADILPVVIQRLRAANKVSPAREISLAVQRAEEALHWITALEGRRK